MSNMTDELALKKPNPDWFATVASKASLACGSRWAFITAIGVIILWAALGPANHYSDTWQLIINTGTTIVTFLMVFLIQNTQNRDSRAINIKLNEIIRAISRADNAVIDIEKLSDEQLDDLAQQYEKIRIACLERRKRREAKQTAEEPQPVS